MTRMHQSTKESAPRTTNNQRLLAYVSDLELEVDRLRKHGRFVQHEARATLKRIRRLCADAAGAGNGNTPSPLPDIDQAAKQLETVLRDIQDPPGYHPAHDQVIAIAVRPLAEKIFRWQQRLEAAPEVA